MSEDKLERKALKLDDGPVFWKEVREQDAVYNVYLKKIKYHTLPEKLEEGQPSISHLASETLKIRSIKAGTLERLIESLVQVSGDLDSPYVNAFLSTYRSFATTSQVLEALTVRMKGLYSNIDNMKDSLRQAHLKSLRSVLSMWIDAYSEDFREPPDFPCLKKLIIFATNNMEDADIALRAKHRMDKFQRDYDMAHRVDPLLFHFCLCDEVDFMLQSEFRRPLEFLKIPNMLFAEQLTHKDAELLKKVVPHHCLGSIWSKSDKKSEDAPTVLATIDQFNAVLFRVVATVLKNPKAKKSQRAKVIMKWIDIAQALRELKNFSSLKAIISGLQSHSVYRLKKTWERVPKEYLYLYQELSNIFSEEDNQIVQRELLMKEGTAKYADVNTIGRNGRPRKSFQKRKSALIENGCITGTVPYLGTFLTDLTMIYTAIPDYTEDGLVNFEKRRKEFEILAQIRLLQSATNLYKFKEDDDFSIWFKSVRVFNEKESCELSCEIERPTSPRQLKNGHQNRHSYPNHTRKNSDESMSSYASSYNADDTSVSSLTLSPHYEKQISHSSSKSSLNSNDTEPSSPYRSPNACVVKVKLQTTDPIIDTSLYKSIMLGNGDHTGSVIKKALDRYNLPSSEYEDYVITQILSDNRELQIPDKANVFYALSSDCTEYMFILRHKSALNELQDRKKGSKKGLKKEKSAER